MIVFHIVYTGIILTAFVISVIKHSLFYPTIISKHQKIFYLSFLFFICVYSFWCYTIFRQVHRGNKMLQSRKWGNIMDKLYILDLLPMFVFNGIITANEAITIIHEIARVINH